LYGLEITRDVVLTKWKERFGPEIYEVISSFAEPVPRRGERNREHRTFMDFSKDP